MIISVDFWQLVGLLVSFIAFAAGAAKLLLRQVEKRIDARFSALESVAAEWRRQEKDFLTFKAELPLQYVRREDYVRNQTVLEAKLDALAVRIDNMKLREVVS